jgi:hypothetical protein
MRMTIGLLSISICCALRGWFRPCLRSVLR